MTSISNSEHSATLEHLSHRPTFKALFPKSFEAKTYPLGELERIENVLKRALALFTGKKDYADIVLAPLKKVAPTDTLLHLSELGRQVHICFLNCKNPPSDEISKLFGEPLIETQDRLQVFHVKEQLAMKAAFAAHVRKK